MKGRKPWGLLGAGLLLVCLAPLAAAAPAARIAVIVANDGSWQGLEQRPTRGVIGRIFLRRLTLDRRGRRLVPVNLPATHPLRRAFTRAVLHRPVTDFEQYWNEQYFNGITPPPVVASQEAMLRFVATTPGAIGYVARCRVDRRVRVLLELPAPGLARARLCPP